MIKIPKKLNYVTIPSAFVDDTKLTLEAKGLLTFIFSNKGRSIEYGDILDKNNLTKDKLSKVIKELSTAGYITADGDDLELSLTPKRNKEEIEVDKSAIKTTVEVDRNKEKTKKLNRWEKCANAIREYTDDAKLQNVLFEYLDMRLNPLKGSKLEGKQPYEQNWRRLLKVLDDFKEEEKVAVVEQSINNLWAWFYELKDNKDNKKIEQGEVKSTKYTLEEVEEIKKKASEMNKSGKRGSF